MLLYKHASTNRAVLVRGVRREGSAYEVEIVDYH